MSQEAKKILPVIFLIGAIGLGWLSWQGYNDILIVKGQIKEIEDKITVLNSSAEKADKFVRYVKDNPDVSEKLNTALSDNGNKPNLVSVLASATPSNGLLLKSVDLADPQDPQVAVADPAAGDKASVQEVKLSFSGTYASLKNFLVFAEKSMKLMDVVSIDFGSSKNDEPDENKSEVAKYDFTVMLKTYYVTRNNNMTPEAKVLLANSLIDLSFVKEKQFTDLVPPQSYNIDTIDNGDWGNKNIF